MHPPQSKDGSRRLTKRERRALRGKVYVPSPEERGFAEWLRGRDDDVAFVIDRDEGRVFGHSQLEHTVHPSPPNSPGGNAINTRFGV